jgi:hypothetical protein
MSSSGAFHCFIVSLDIASVVLYHITELCINSIGEREKNEGEESLKDQDLEAEVLR